MKTLVLIVSMSILLQGCFPVYKTIRPLVEVQLVDQAGQALEGVKVVRVTEQTPARVEAIFDTAKSNREGWGSFEQKRKWEIEFFMIHGVQYYNWSLCVSKKGYKTIDQIKIDPDSDKRIVLIMEKTKNKSEECFDES